MKLSECRIGMIVQETEQYFNKVRSCRVKDRRIGWIKDLSMNCTNEIILLVRFPYYEFGEDYHYKDILIHPANVEKYKGED